jgi:outer membrane protein OmpA-like peptidoglycan-associated protein
MKDFSNRQLFLALVVAVLLAIALPATAQEKQSTAKPESQTQKSQPAQTQAPQPAQTQASQPAEKAEPTGKKIEVKGVIVKRDADTFTMRDQQGQQTVVTLNNETEVKEKKSNPFRRAKNFATTQIMRGLVVEVEGYGDTGRITADEIRFTDVDYRMASSVESAVVPVEGRLTQSETRLTQAETNAQRLSGQVDELSAVSNAAKGGAKAAQETADAAMSGVNQNKQQITATGERVARTNERISALDDYDVKQNLVVNFKVGSAVLSKEVQAQLDTLADQAKTDKGYVIEVSGFASAEGGEDYNRRLSQRRADAVIQYLAENHQIPLRRIVTPFGYGEKQPVADNATREGRQQNRRVEVKILMNKGLNETAKSASAPSGS